jgi:hypothetical protein
MRILIANDDGIYSPGIATLAEMAVHRPCWRWFSVRGRLWACDRRGVAQLLFRTPEESL